MSTQRKKCTPTESSSQHAALKAWAWRHPKQAAWVLFNNVDRLPDGRADEGEVRAYIDAQIADGTPLNLLGSLVAVKAAETAGKLGESLERFVCLVSGSEQEAAGA